MKALVEVDVGAIIKEGRKVGSAKDGIFWVKFRYEKLAQFCYYYGSLSCEEKGCETIMADEGKGVSNCKDLGP